MDIVYLREICSELKIERLLLNLAMRLPDGMFPVVNAGSYMNFPPLLGSYLLGSPPLSLSSKRNYRDSSLLLPPAPPPFQVQLIVQQKTFTLLALY